MTETPKDRLSPPSLADMNPNSQFNLAYQAWRQGDPLPLATHIRENGIGSQWEARMIAAIVERGDGLRRRKNSVDKKILELKQYARLKRVYEENDHPLAWEEIYRRIAYKLNPKADESKISSEMDALKTLRKREGIK
jgi:hypothetical protein